MQVKTKIQQDQLETAKNLAEKYAIPLVKARVLLASGNPVEASRLLEFEIQQAEEHSWGRDLISLYIFQSIVNQALNQEENALRILNEALTLAEPQNLIRTFIDEGKPVSELLSKAAVSGMMPDYLTRLKNAFAAIEGSNRGKSSEIKFSNQPLPAPDQLSGRELEILQLIAQGLSNRQISEKLYLTLNTIKGHNQKIYRKLQVNRRTEAIVRARELELL